MSTKWIPAFLEDYKFFNELMEWRDNRLDKVTNKTWTILPLLRSPALTCQLRWECLGKVWTVECTALSAEEATYNVLERFRKWNRQNRWRIS